MEKIKGKLQERKKQKRKEALKNMSEREKVEERREEVLSKGRKFKYPLQYAKHKVMLLTSVVAVVAILAIGVIAYVMLYKTQSTGEILYRVTRVVPVSVAKFAGEKVRYSDYLLIYRSTITPVERQGQIGEGEDAENMRKHYKRQSLNAAEEYAYAMKLARENNIIVSAEEIDKEIEKQRKTGGTERSEESFAKILSDNFGLTMNEYRRMIEMALTKAKVQTAIDVTAKNVVNEIQQQLAAGTEFQEIVEKLGDKVLYEETGGLVDKMNIDDGRANVAIKMEPGQVSEPVLSASGAGYYFVKLVNKNETSVDYVSIEVPFTEFDKQVMQVRQSGDFKEMIELSEDEAQGIEQKKE